jgi:hypothetical protein
VVVVERGDDEIAELNDKLDRCSSFTEGGRQQ